MDSLEIKVKYLTEQPPLEFVAGKSDWIDLRAACDVYMKQGEFKIIPLGVAMQLPEGYEAHIVPRSSTFKKWGILQANSMGIIDESYCGDNDQWGFPALCMVDNCYIRKGDRICQFRIMPKMGHDTILKTTKSTLTTSNGRIIEYETTVGVSNRYDVVFNKVKSLGNEDRGGFGSTGEN